MMLWLYQDGGPRWYREVADAARARGWMFRLFTHPWQVNGDRYPGYAFTRISQFPPFIDMDRARVLEALKRPGVKPIQDVVQLLAYENKLMQTVLWHDWMPKTIIKESRESALAALENFKLPFISKASVGSASLNVRFVETRDQAVAEIDAVFGGPGISIRRGPGPAVRQRGYLLWQEFIPHHQTYRVTAIGTKRHVYARFNYADRPMAAPSKITPTQPLPQELAERGLLEFSNAFFEAAGTKFCAIDVLWDAERGGYRLLETAQSWARGDDAAGNATFYGTKYSLLTQHELLLDELAAGSFS